MQENIIDYELLVLTVLLIQILYEEDAVAFRLDKIYLGLDLAYSIFILS